ncbi:MAG: hypothetical protein Ta2B_27340 [Termitinemataceae bacterium]|nr:MAG: hypothetical protein Ta2B_27340 [Termitinemataceae bacterium]
MALWDTNSEISFFKQALAGFASPEQLFYNLNSGFFAYVPKNQDTEGQTLQSRNSLIGQFTEKWTKDLFEPIARHYGLYAINTVECSEVGLIPRSEADLAFCTTNSNKQPAKNIKIIFEIKMSIVSNYKYTPSTSAIECVGDFKTHKGNPSLLRSDSMLKAIGKSINIRVSGIESTRIPIVILGNSPITSSYCHKVDFLKTAGVVQGFWSLNPSPTDEEFVGKTEKLGFQTVENINLLTNLVGDLLATDMNYFSSMISKPKLGEFIRIANKEPTDEAKADKFLTLIRSL